jgi:hypothetical protein
MELLGRYDRTDVRGNMVHNGLGNRLDRNTVAQALKGLEHKEETDLAGHARRQSGGERLLLKRGGIDLGEITHGDRRFQSWIRRIMDTGHGDPFLATLTAGQQCPLRASRPGTLSNRVPASSIGCRA